MATATVAPEALAAALRAQRAVSRITVGELVEATASLSHVSPRTLQRRLDTGAGITLDEVNAFAMVMSVPTSRIFKLAQVLQESEDD